MNIVINSGTIGTPAALLLAKQGHNVALAVRSPKPSADWDKAGLKQIAFDINNSKSMESALHGADAFFSISPLVQNLVESGVATIKAAKRAGVKRIVRSSALGASPDAAIQLGKWHSQVEMAVEDSGIPFTIVRPANFMQNYLGYDTIKKQNAFYLPLGDAKISIVDTRDVSAVAAAALVEPGHEGKRYNLTGGESLTNVEIASILAKLLGREIKYVDVPKAAANESMTKAGMPSWLVQLISELNAVGKAGYLAGVSPDISKVLKRQPTTFAAFAADHKQSF